MRMRASARTAAFGRTTACAFPARLAPLVPPLEISPAAAGRSHLRDGVQRVVRYPHEGAVEGDAPRAARCRIDPYLRAVGGPQLRDGVVAAVRDPDVGAVEADPE